MSDEIRALRNAFGAFATGVTIVTTVDSDGVDHGLTANSFSSVSLDPPLLLWSLSRGATSFAAFNGSLGFAVHILSSEQTDLSNRFASKGADKFAGLKLGRGENGVPLLEDCAARFICRTTARHDAGDHVIMLGEILHFDHNDHHPLIYHRGRYAALHRAETAAG